MNKTTARELLKAYAEAKSAWKRIRKRQVEIGAQEYENARDAFDDFRYFGDKIEDGLDAVEHLVDVAREVMRKK